MKRKKLTALMMVAAMAVSMLAGWGQTLHPNRGGRRIRTASQELPRLVDPGRRAKEAASHSLWRSRLRSRSMYVPEIPSSNLRILLCIR